MSGLQFVCLAHKPSVRWHVHVITSPLVTPAYGKRARTVLTSARKTSVARSSPHTTSSSAELSLPPGGCSVSTPTCRVACQRTCALFSGAGTSCSRSSIRLRIPSRFGWLCCRLRRFCGQQLERWHDMWLSLWKYLRQGPGHSPWHCFWHGLGHSYRHGTAWPVA